MSKSRKKKSAKAEPVEKVAETPLETEESPEEKAAEEPEWERELAGLRERENQLLRNLAEKENQVRRMSRDLELSKSLQRGELAQPFLDILDDLDRALQNRPEEVEDSFIEGLEMVSRRFREALALMGITVIEALGKPFDPQFHEALLELPGVDAEKGIVIQEIQKGYLLEGRVLRASKVAVAG